MSYAFGQGQALASSVDPELQSLLPPIAGQFILYLPKIKNYRIQYHVQKKWKYNRSFGFSFKIVIQGQHTIFNVYNGCIMTGICCYRESIAIQ